jgi:hypothetical protein
MHHQPTLCHCTVGISLSIVPCLTIFSLIANGVSSASIHARFSNDRNGRSDFVQVEKRVVAFGLR